MKKSILKASVVSSLLCSLTFAEGAFIGFESDYSFQSNLKTKGLGDKVVEVKDGQAGIGLKLGYDFDIYRVYGSYIYDFEAKKTIQDDTHGFVTPKWTTHKLIVGADYTPSITNDFKLAIGAYTGMSIINLKATYKDNGNYVENSDNSEGLILGAKLGGIYSIDSNNEIEFGFKTDRTKYRKFKDSLDLRDTRETNYGLYIGYNYKF
ncbi:hypothetical protein [Campylobacter hyointestinalis]|uniref:hypothetical protein n=1 Tax=Campylobacter hyointestinalis TaxID=198 RepID=UPI001BD6CD23|nr:hypothetical protein [Campylobacter hyointestinalis]MBT0611550.1 hypothetical protein [Campylobacter hyointestinalis subsp. hyointestinalis]MDY2999093.1 hypothetical protein [Campylobacter hyointestinalis]